MNDAVDLAAQIAKVQKKPMLLFMNKNDAPKEYQVGMTPVFHYVRAEGSKIQETLVGGKTGLFFLNILKKAVELN